MLQRKSLKKKRKITKKKNQETWLQVKQEIRPKFIEAGITCCELQWEHCKGCLPVFLTFAHSLRRRKIDKLDKEARAKALRRVIRACTACHMKLDSLEHAVTEKIVEQVIAERPTPII